VELEREVRLELVSFSRVRMLDLKVFKVDTGIVVVSFALRRFEEGGSEDKEEEEMRGSG